MLHKCSVQTWRHQTIISRISGSYKRIQKRNFAVLVKIVLKMFRVALLVGVIFVVNVCAILPLDAEEAEATEIPESLAEATTTVASNNTGENLYVIKSVVYEIGILTDAGNDTSGLNETHEQIDVSFFDANNNGTFFDLSSIPIPIQTNVSGVSVTGILPANFGDISLLKDGTATLNGSTFPLLPEKEYKVTHNISTVDKDRGSSILSGLSEVLGLGKITGNSENNTDDGAKES